MSMERLKHEERLKDEKLITPNSPYYNKPEEYSLAIYSYYMCYKCKKPYFGGLKSCENLQNEGGGGEGGQQKEEFIAEDLICANCCDIPVQDCKKHGKDFIEFKCKFCCSIAVWFCFGNTHFCEPCHQNAYKAKAQKCPGKDKCPLKVEHKPNGEECALGCALCRNYKENLKEF